MKKISIIIPCYNCEDTVEEAVRSCYTQGILENDFEIILVDDYSTDKTASLLTQIAKDYSNSKILSHEKNRGGGAARNTGIKSSDGKYIFCLDSDNVFAPQTLSVMLEYLEKNSCDGVAIEERRFFNKTIKNFEPSRNPISSKGVVLGDLFTEKSVLLDNFLYSRESYDRTAGYPENHGFDTQCFEVRYLSANNKVLVCPGTIFYHRQVGKKESYFEREYNKGNFSINYYLIIEEILNILSDTAIEEILQFDILSRTSSRDNLFLQIKKLSKENTLFDDKNQKSETHQLYIQAISLYHKEEFRASLEKLVLVIEKGVLTPVTQYAALRALYGINHVAPVSIENTVGDFFKKIKTNKPPRLYRWYYRFPIFSHILSLINKIRQ